MIGENPVLYLDFLICMELGLKDTADLNDIDPLVLNFYRGATLRKLERDTKIATMQPLRGLF